MDFRFPDVGEGIAEGDIVKWLVAVGDIVVADQAIVQVETDKAIVDLPAPVGGKITAINFKEGDSVKVGQVLCAIGGKSDAVKEKKEAPMTKNAVAIEKNISGEGKTDMATIVPMPQAVAMRGTQESNKILASPAVRKLAKEKGVDLHTVNGSGKGGVILKEDLGREMPKNIDTVPQQTIQIKKKFDDYGAIEHIPLKGIRKTIAEAMIRSQTETAPVTAMEDIDISTLWAIREREKKVAEKQGAKLTFMPYVIKAVIASLKENPMLNSSIIGEEIVVRKYYNIGVAVETDVGLMVPVVKIADSKNLLGLAKEITDLADKARKRTIDIMDLSDSTFTITNYGSVGGTYGTPIINPGEAAILGLGRIFDRVALDEKGKLKNIKILPVSLTFDHRILDGAQAARFLESLKDFLEDPDHLMLEMK